MRTSSIGSGVPMPSIVKGTPGGPSVGRMPPVHGPGGGRMGCVKPVLNGLWFLLVGLWMTIAHVVTGVLVCLTIIGIPSGIADVKLAAAAIAPLGEDIVPTDDPRAFAPS